jgi:superfamily II DNA or RNA helicase
MQSTFFDNEYTSPLLLAESISKQPRYYQANATHSVATALLEGHTRICVKSPTGTGKTLISKLVALSKSVRNAAQLPQAVIDGTEKLRVLYISNKHRLNRQAVEEYAENDSLEIIPQSAFSGIPQDVIEAGWHFTFVDECHHEAMMSIQYLLDDLKDRPLIGFTAEDKRGDGLVIKFSKMIVAISEREAAERGFNEKAGINSIVDFSGTDKTPLARKLMEKYASYAGNGILFFRTEKEVLAITATLKRMGFKAASLTGKDSEAEMDRQLNRLSSGEIQFIVNCQRIGEGIDAANITDVFLFRTFNSFAEKKQFIGRAIRPDSPCAVWEVINPLMDSVQAKDCVGLSKYERLLYLDDNEEWVEEMVSGDDPTWGQMSQLRVHPGTDQQAA